MIKIIDSLYLTEKGCSIKKRNYHPVHIRQGDIDGACAYLEDDKSSSD